MKSIYKSICFCLIAIVSTGIWTSCSEEEDLPFGGEPMVSYVRITNPASSDSLLVAAGQGSMIAIIGNNLQGAQQVWFNDRRASLSPTYITSETIITRVPSEIPIDISNMMKIYFANGDSLLYDFSVDISEPEVNSMLSEYVNSGEVARIRGNYFYEPLTVTFSGGVDGEVVNINNESTVIEVLVPEGAEPGPVTVTTGFGETESNFWFNDNRNIIAGFEETDFTGWWQGSQYIVESDPVIDPVNNKFLRIDQVTAAWSWLEMWVGDGGTILEATKNIPQEAFSNPRNYSLKFEINALEPLTGAEMRMFMGNSGGNFNSDRQNIYHVWKANLNLVEGWQTVTIPFESLLDANTTLSFNPDGYQVSFYFSSPVETTLNFGLDNIRVVPNTVE